MNSAKKAEERRLVAHFVAAWSGGGAIATFDPNWKESPDFAGVLSDGRPFGLEVVTVTDKSLAKSGSDIHRRFVPELQAACLKRAVGALLHVSLQEWDAIRLGDRKHRRRLVERVADFVLEQRHHQETLERDALEARGIEGLDALTLYEETTGNVGVMVGRTAWGRGCDVVQDAIAAKDTKATAYRRRLGDGVELWLLVVAGTSFADGVEPPLSTSHSIPPSIACSSSTTGPSDMAKHSTASLSCRSVGCRSPIRLVERPEVEHLYRTRRRAVPTALR